jgi:hypothetical protein
VSVSCECFVMSEVSATGRSLIQRSPTCCDASDLMGSNLDLSDERPANYRLSHGPAATVIIMCFVIL